MSTPTNYANRPMLVVGVNLVTTLYNALLRPRRLIASFEEGGWRAIGGATLATLLWVSAALALIVLLLRATIPLDSERLLLNLAIAPLLAWGGSGLCIIANTSTATPRTVVAFWMLRCQIAVTPPLALIVVLGSSPALSPQQGRWLGLILLTLVGAWFGGGLTVAFELRPNRAEAAGARYLLAGGALVISGAIWRSPPLYTTDWVAYVPFCLGLALGLLRPLSYLWQATTSLALVGAARRGRAPVALLALHPLSCDDLCLLPLPGLHELLRRACAADSQQGGTWLLRAAEHAGQRAVARRAAISMAADPQLAHPLLFWLSRNPRGAQLLRELAEFSDAPPPLIAAYAALAHVATPAAWAEVLAAHHAAFVAAASFSGGPALLALLEASAALLDADRWATIASAMHPAPALSANASPDALWCALNRVRAWAARQTPHTTDDRVAALRALLADLSDLDGWPVALLAAAGEHWLFLIRVEQARGARG